MVARVGVNDKAPETCHGQRFYEKGGQCRFACTAFY
jgi:hypothetical protein